jgi:hypothetical protein
MTATVSNASFVEHGDNSAVDAFAATAALDDVGV